MKKTLLLASLLALAGTNVNAEKIQISVKSSDGTTGIDGVQVQYVTSQFYNVGTTANGGQIATTDFPTLAANTKYRLKLTYKGTTFTTDQFTATSAGVNSYTINTGKLVVKALGNSNEPVNGLTLRYTTNGTFNNMPATVNGESSMELLPSTNLRVNMTSAGTYKDRYVNLTSATRTEDTFTLSKVTVPGAYFLAGTSGIGSWMALSGGLYVFPGTHTVRFGTEKASLLVENTDINKTPFIVRLVNSKNEPISGAAVHYYENGWVAAATTNANGNTLVFTGTDLASLYTQVTHLGANQVKQGCGVGNTVKYQTRNCTVNFTNSENAPMNAQSVYFYANGWQSFSNTTNGVAKMELLPYHYYIQLNYGGASQQKEIAATDSVVNYQTRNYAVNFVNSEKAPMSPESVYYYANGWQSFSNTTNGVAKMELLPYHYYIQLNYGGASQQKEIPETDSVVNYSTKKVTMNVKNCQGNALAASGAVYYASGWKTFGTGTMTNGTTQCELLPSYYYFNVDVNGTNQQLEQAISGDTVVNYVATNVNAVWPSHKIQSAQYYSNSGWRTMNIHGNGSSADVYILPGTYYFLVDGIQVNKTVAGCNTQIKFNKDGGLARMGEVNPEFTAYPNPAKDFISVKMTESGTVTIYSIDGKRVASHSVTAGDNRLDISSLTPGTYMLVNGTATVQIVKQ